MNLEESINKWLDYLLIDKKFSKNTIKTYKSNLYSFKDFIGKDKIVKNRN